jgi:protoheme ferro-lyase
VTKDQSTKKIAVVLFNLGGPDGPEAVQPFLYNLFADKAIIGAPAGIRQALAFMISTLRKKSAQANYNIMGGGSPILPQTTAQAEALARAQFARRRDPFECALLYVALGKRVALQALFRQGSNVRLADFLARDFLTEEGRHAAAKNAFALLGQHR